MQIILMQQKRRWKDWKLAFKKPASPLSSFKRYVTPFVCWQSMLMRIHSPSSLVPVSLDLDLCLVIIWTRVSCADWRCCWRLYYRHGLRWRQSRPDRIASSHSTSQKCRPRIAQGRQRRCIASFFRLSFSLLYLSGYVKVYIILPSTIYGIASGVLVETGIQNPHSVQVPGLIQIALSRGRAGMVGAGKNVWPNVDIEEGKKKYDYYSECS